MEDQISELVKKAANSLKLDKSVINFFTMGDQIWRGEEFVKKAEKKLNGDRVGEVYVKLASCHLKLDRRHEAARAYNSAAHYYKKTKKSSIEAISSLEKAAHIFLDIGRLNAATGYYEEIAKLYENENNLELAMIYYQKTADLFQSMDLTSSANQCRQKIAEYSAKVGKYQRSIVMFEEIATYSIRNNLLKYGVRGHLLNAGICQLCTGNVVAINNTLERYQILDPTFSGSREFKFLMGLAVAIDKKDVAKFTSCLKKYDSTIKLDEWRTPVLLKMKDALKAKELESIGRFNRLESMERFIQLFYIIPCPLILFCMTKIRLFETKKY
ncbi:alpha-soluble NSF attachment protein-like isoform X2 [Solanum dulcamara]|uniref:alpha-soluble NSF attachment protein-like isoform X2 n=1 Tax=Solanum dulcamara TaxID=45834 RepID=UPI0024858576|nr:alpha-soluble NSF attachment protein-like isoform X2 [Solanum dulcamara]